MIIEVVGKEIEKIKGDFESYLNGLNMVGEISYSQYSNLYDEGTKQIQRAYELGRAELEKENAELKDRNQELLESCEGATMMYKDLCKAKEIIKKYLAIGVGGKITQNYLDVTKEAKQFLKEE